MKKRSVERPGVRLVDPTDEALADATAAVTDDMLNATLRMVYRSFGRRSTHLGDSSTPQRSIS